MAHLKYYSYAGHGEFMTKNFGYSQSVNINGVIEMAGQGGWLTPRTLLPSLPSPHCITLTNFVFRDDEGKFPEDLDEHIHLAFKNCEKALKDAGGKGFDEVYSLVTYHCPMDDESLGIAVKYVKMYLPHKPIWTAVGVPALAEKQM